MAATHTEMELEMEAALERVDEALDTGIHRIYELRKRLKQRRRLATHGAPLLPSIEEYKDNGHGSLTQQISEFTEDFVKAAAQLRRAEARILYAEGATMEQIAEVFGVTRQRISMLLAEDTRNSRI